jgi:hypothetical protein
MVEPTPMQPQPKVPLTPGRFAFGLACLAIATCGVLSPVSLMVSLWSLRRPEPLGFAAVVMSLTMVALWVVGLYIYASPVWIPWLP